jgi:hypothetical protein
MESVRATGTYPTPNVLKLVMTRLIPDQPDHVDAHLVEEHAVRDQPPDREPPQPGTLAPGDGLERAAVLGAGPHLDFADHQHLALGRHDVDLAFRAPPVAVEDS